MKFSNPFRALILAASVITAIYLAARLAPLAGTVTAAIIGVAFVVILSALITPRDAACYVNNFGVLNNTIVLNDAFAEFWQFLLPITRMALNVADEIILDSGQVVLVRSAKPGTTVTIKNWKQAFNVYDVTAAGGYLAPTDITPQDTQFTLPNTAKACSIQLSPEDFRVISSGVTGGNDYDAFRRKVVNGMLHALGAAIVGDFLAVLTAGNYPGCTVSLAGTYSGATELLIEKAFYDRSVPLDNPQIILNSAAFLEYTNSFLPQQNFTQEQIQKKLLFQGEQQSRITSFTNLRTQSALPAPDSDRGIALYSHGCSWRLPHP